MRFSFSAETTRDTWCILAVTFLPYLLYWFWYEHQAVDHMKPCKATMGMFPPWTKPDRQPETWCHGWLVLEEKARTAAPRENKTSLTARIYTQQSLIKQDNNSGKKKQNTNTNNPKQTNKKTPRQKIRNKGLLCNLIKNVAFRRK